MHHPLTSRHPCCKTALYNNEYVRWVKATEAVNAEWIREVNAKGGNGKALLNDAKTLLKKYND